MRELYEIRCPGNVNKGNSKNFLCNTLQARISGVSTSEFLCRKCKMTFKAVINEDGEVTYMDYQLKEIKPIKPKTAEDRLFDLLNSQK